MATLQPSLVRAKLSGRPAAEQVIRAPFAPAAPPSVASTSTAPSAAAVPGTSANLVSFMTNLRLLDLDLLPDWPHIIDRTFSTRDPGQGQRKRVHCVEWALYQLFSLWDPEEAQAVGSRITVL
jgi:hypothetical protein